MKFLYLTDTHWRSDKPRHRIDDSYKTQFQELGEISNIVTENDVDYILHGGDCFHTPRPSHELIKDLISWIKFISVPVLVLPGNHDLLGYNPESISSVALGVLFESEAFHQLTEQVFQDEKIYIKGVLPEVEPHNDKYIIDEKYKDYTKIIISHNYINPDPLPFLYLPTAEVKTNADLFLLGHYHKPSDITIGKTRFINPGALSRWAIDEASRIPTILLIDITGGIINIDKIPLSCAKKAEKIFDLNSAALVNQKEDQLAAFMESLESTSFESVDIEQLVLSAGKNQKLEEKILNKSLEKIREAKEVLK